MAGWPVMAMLTSTGVAPAPSLAQGQSQAGAPVEIRIGANAGFTKIEFAGVVGSRARVRQDGRTVVVRIGTTAAPDVSRLRVDPPKGLEKIETRAAQGATELILTLAEGAGATSGTADFTPHAVHHHSAENVTSPALARLSAKLASPSCSPAYSSAATRNGPSSTPKSGTTSRHRFAA